jgi:tetratricopeptide (TPR) repeat protein
MRLKLALSLLLLSGMAAAAQAPKPAAKPAAKPAQPQKPLTEAQLLEQLKKADSAEAAKPIEEKLAGLYRASGSPSIDLLMTRARAVALSDKKAARKLINAVTNIVPRYAEGWRTRAALESEMGEDAAAMVSLQKTVLINPRHFMALVELGDLLQEYGDKAQALKLYRQAAALNPQMEGAEMRIRELTRAVEGQDI